MTYRSTILFSARKISACNTKTKELRGHAKQIAKIIVKMKHYHFFVSRYWKVLKQDN